MNAYAISLSKYVNTGLIAAFTLLAWLGFVVPGPRLRRAIEIFQHLLLAAFLANANMTIAWIIRGEEGRKLLLLCAMEILFLLSFMVLYRIVHEMADMFLFNNICMLLSVGFVIVARIALYGVDEFKTNEPIKQFVMASAGLMLMLVIPFFRRFFDGLRHMWMIFAVSGIVVLAGVLLLSAATNGAMITYTLAGFTFQPSEFVKILYILMLAGIFSTEMTREKVIFATGICLAHVGLLVLSYDLGSALIFFIVYLMMLFLATGRWLVLISGAALCTLGSVASCLLLPYVKNRFVAWIDPFPVIEEQGFQIAHSLFAISYGGLWGAGLTQGSPDKIYAVESDFIFAAIVEEMGIIFGICLLLLCINSFLRILSLSASYSNRFFQLFTYGAAVCYIFQTFLTVGGQTKFLPLTGVTLPLVSYGGSSILSTLIMLGIVEMINILHDERTVRFLERYEMERREMGYGEAEGAGPYYEGSGQAENGLPGWNASWSGTPPYGGMQPGPENTQKEPYYHIPPDPEGSFGNPDNFPVNGISEDGIFDDL